MFVNSFGKLVIHVEEGVSKARMHVLNLDRELFRQPLLILFDLVSIIFIQLSIFDGIARSTQELFHQHVHLL